jgi:alanyl-tRNA synthetase
MAIRLMAYQERLDELKVQQTFYQQAILSYNIQHVKKGDVVRKGYKDDTASKKERQLLTKIAVNLYDLYGFPLKNDNVKLQNNENPTFGDVLAAVGFWTKSLV